MFFCVRQKSMSISALTRLSHTGQKFSEKIFWKGYSPILKCCSHRSYAKFLHKIFSICNSLLRGCATFFSHGPDLLFQNLLCAILFLQKKKGFFAQNLVKTKKDLQPTDCYRFSDVLQRTNKIKNRNQGLASVTHNIVSARKDQLTNQCRKFNAGHFETFGGSQVACRPRVERPWST